MKFPMNHSSFEGQAMAWAQPRRTATRSSLPRCRKLGRRSCKRCVRWNTGGFYVVACFEGWKDKKPVVQWGWNWFPWFKMVKQMDKSHFKWFNMVFLIESNKPNCSFNLRILGLLWSMGAFLIGIFAGFNGRNESMQTWFDICSQQKRTIGDQTWPTMRSFDALFCHQTVWIQYSK